MLLKTLNKFYVLLQVERQSVHTENVSESIKNLRKDVKSLKTESNKYIEGAEGVVKVSQSVVDNMHKFTSGDPLEIASGAIAIIGTVGGIVGGPAGPLIAGVCGLVSSILPLFGGEEGPSMGDVVDKVIREALEDFRDESIYAEVIDSLKEMTANIAELNGVASHNGGKMSNEEKSFLTTLDFSIVGSRVLAELQTQLDKHKDTTDEKKCSRLAMYCYYYCLISVQKQVILTLHCSLLRRNDMESIYAGVANYFFNVLPKEDKKVLAFISELPESGWWMLYRYLHTSLEAPQRTMISGYRKQIGCDEMTGQLCIIYNEKQKEYLYTAENGMAYDENRRSIFTWRKGTADSQMLFRIVGSRTNCEIYSVYFSEYLYAADYAPYDDDRRRVFSYRTGNRVSQGFWDLSNGLAKNIKQNEYMYAADYDPYDDERRRVFTWRPGNPVTQGNWKIVNLSFEEDDLTKPRK